MTIGFHYHIPAIQKEDGKIYMPGYLGVFIDGLASQCEQVICFMHSPLESEMGLMDYALGADNVQLVDMGPHISMMKRALKAKQYNHKILPFLPKLDVMLIRGPSPLLPTLTSLCKKYHIKVAYLLVGDYLEGLNAATTMHKVKKTILWLYYAYNKYGQDRYLDDTLVFVNSSKLYKEYINKNQHCIEVRTTTLTKADFFQRLDTCQNSTVELLYTGRIDPTKGIEDIFQAVALLKDKIDKDIRINLVGWETSSGFLSKLQQLAKELNIENNYIFHGKKSVGKELFDMYRKSDIYILASRGDFEGFPRTLWEAMANSLPLIATKVGSIPYLLKDEKNTLLVEPNNSQNLENTIEQLIQSEDLRIKLIKNGYSLAKTNTIEIISKKMVDMRKRYLKIE
jgi:glycosyltransferase involved in cell wall biosynthesis